MVAISGQFGSFNALLNLHRAQSGQDQTIARLSNGERIQKASDDPSGLAISNELQSEVKALKHLKRNHFEGITAIQLADANLEELTHNLSRIGELAMQAASDVLWEDNSPALDAINNEYREILGAIDQIDIGTRYNDLPLFGSSPASFTIYSDADPSGGSESIVVNFSSFSSAALGLAGSDMTTNANASAILGIVDNVLENVSRRRGQMATLQRRLEDNMNNLDERMVELDSQDIGIRSTDVAREAINITKYNMLNRSALAVVAQTNLEPDRVFQLLN